MIRTCQYQLVILQTHKFILRGFYQSLRILTLVTYQCQYLVTLVGSSRVEFMGIIIANEQLVLSDAENRLIRVSWHQYVLISCFVFGNMFSIEFSEGV